MKEENIRKIKKREGFWFSHNPYRESSIRYHNKERSTIYKSFSYGGFYTGCWLGYIKTDFPNDKHLRIPNEFLLS